MDKKFFWVSPHNGHCHAQARHVAHMQGLCVHACAARTDGVAAALAGWLMGAPRIGPTPQPTHAAGVWFEGGEEAEVV